MGFLSRSNPQTWKNQWSHHKNYQRIWESLHWTEVWEFRLRHHPELMRSNLPPSPLTRCWPASVERCRASHATSEQLQLSSRQIEDVMPVGSCHQLYTCQPSAKRPALTFRTLRSTTIPEWLHFVALYTCQTSSEIGFPNHLHSFIFFLSMAWICDA